MPSLLPASGSGESWFEPRRGNQARQRLTVCRASLFATVCELLCELLRGRSASGQARTVATCALGEGFVLHDLPQRVLVRLLIALQQCGHILPTAGRRYVFPWKMLPLRRPTPIVWSEAADSRMGSEYSRRIIAIQLQHRG